MVDLNLFERALATVLPDWGARRLGGKVALAQIRSIAADIEVRPRGFDAGRRGRRTEGWFATGGSANAELAPSLQTMIRRSRDLCRNNEWSKNAKRKWVAHLVGSGITPRPDADNERAKKTARQAWNVFADNCDPEGMTDIYGIQARAVGEMFEGGAAFVRWYLRPPEFGLKVPLQCQVLEHDFLDARRFELNTENNNLVIHGVEYDKWGRRVAYWLYSQHPGEVLPIARSTLLSQRVPASEVDHLFVAERAGQATGVPWLASAMLRLRDMADRDEAALVREKIAACFAVFVRRQGGVANSLAQAADRSTDAKGRDVEKMRPGMIGYVESDGDITVAQPPNAGDTEFTDRNLYGVAAGVGLTHSSLSGNLKNVNFTSLREGKLDFWPIVDQVQWHTLVPQLCVPSWRRCMGAAAARGLQVSADLGAKWSMPKRPWVNPVDDMKGEAGELAMALESWADKVTSRGHDPDELIAEIKLWKDKLEAAGISTTAPAGIAGDRLQQQQGGTGSDPAQPPGN